MTLQPWLRASVVSSLLVLSVGSAHGSEGVIDPYLRDRLARAAAGEKVPAYLVMHNHLTLEALDEICRGLSPRERRARVSQELQDYSAKSQADLRQYLDQAVSRGRATRVSYLWMGNAIVFEADAAIIRDLATFNGVDRIRADVSHGQEAYQDAAPGTPTATYPFLDDFESGSLSSAWVSSTTNTGYVQVSSAQGPNGNFHVLMASSVDSSQSTASITVSLDLTAQSNVGIRFEHKEFSDEDSPADGVYISEDGVSYTKILDLFGGTSSYSTKAIMLDDAIALHGLSYTSNFHIRFSWEDNFDITTDGFAFDDIEIAPGVGVPPPPSPEPNIVQLQAPMLWDIGFDGSGVVIANIDSGVDWPHPDLVNHIWTNPGEIDGNSQDDDNNGYIDDLHGWDWDANNNDPRPNFSTHGTNTAGLMVGDGSNGFITGMATGGTLIALEINGEADFWMAQQYALVALVDVISSSHSFKWPFSPKPDYHFHRRMCEMELAAGIIHANSIGNQGNLTGSGYPIPWNISAPGNCPTPFNHPESVPGERTSIMGCAGIHVPDDSLYTCSGQGPAAWENITLYDAAYPHGQAPRMWDYPYGGFGGGQPGLMKPDVVTYTNTVLSTDNGSGYAQFGGTSAATPQLGGAMMLLRSVQPEAMPRHISAALELTAVDLGPAGKDTRYGSGKVQVFDAGRRLVILARADNQAPSLGDTVTIDLFGEPNTILFGLVGGAIASAGSDVNLLPPIAFLGTFPLDSNGEGSLAAAVPNDNNLSGVTAYLQFGSTPVDIPSWGVGTLMSVPEVIAIQ
jgi:subtilisin family serine protease